MFGKKKAQRQQQIDQQMEVKTQLIRSQIDSMFEQFENVILYLKTDKPSPQFLLTLNDSAVSILKLLGATCKDHVDSKEKNVLIAAYAHFDTRKQEMGTDGRVIKHWLNYAECALLGKKLNKLKISQITIDAAHRNMQQGGMTNFLDNYVGANHDTQDIVSDAQRNREQYKSKNREVIADKKQSYEERKAMIQCPGQNKMYDVAGGAQNIQFGSSLYHPSSKYYHQRPRDDQDDHKDNRQPKTAMEEDDNENDKTGKKDQPTANSGLMNVDESASNKNNQKKNPWLNSYVKKAPPQTIMVANKPVQINYPYPCKIATDDQTGKIISFHNGTAFGVVYAKPYENLRVKIEAANLERDTVKVSKLETRYMTECNLTGDNPLGYESIVDQQFQ
mmetsp:Transcript_6104/g.5335  ORF Transcript_6104/g.5335 Transcript_6104/m.5335 type:complete len:390 (+) Transcript_6104:88-1257(+)